MIQLTKKHSFSFITISGLLFLISPILSIPFIFRGLKNRNYSAFFFYALVLGTFAYIMLPYQDLYRHSLNYYSWDGVPFDHIKFIDLMLNGLITYVEWFMVNYDIPFEYLRFFEIIIAFLLLSKIFNYLLVKTNRDYTNIQLFNRLLIFLLFFDFFYTAEGTRFGFALSFYLYGVHALIDLNSKWKCTFFVVIAGLIHLSFIFLSPIVFFLYNLKLQKYQALVLVVILFFVFGVLISQFAYLLGSRAEWYFSNKEGGVASYSAMTTFGLIGFFMPKLAAIPFILLLFRYYDKNNRWNRMSLAWLIISMITLINPVLFYRIIWVFMAMGIYLLLSIEQVKIINTKLISYMIIGGLIFISVNTMRYSYSMIRSPLITKIFFSPVVLFSSQPYFDKTWLNQNVKPDGYPR
ncbi:MAG: hypothetical protein HDR96_01795 [Bacteroides sp.]|nr:hypothetical protein [Bacteroides sp.]